MKNFNNTVDFETELIKKEIDSLKSALKPLNDNLKIPDTVKPDYILNSFKTDSQTDNPQPAKKIKKFPFKIVAFAAVFLIVFAAAATYFFPFFKKDSTLKKPDFPASSESFSAIEKNKPLPVAKSYADIEKILSGVVTANEKLMQEANNASREGGVEGDSFVNVSEAAPTAGAEEETASTSYSMKDAAGDTGLGGADESSRQSETNTQVEGVDEADIVKLYNGRLYYLNENTIYIAKASNTGKDLALLGEVKPVVYDPKGNNYSWVHNIYVKDNLLIVMLSSNMFVENESSASSWPTDDLYDDYANYRGGTTYSYTETVIYDVADPKNPKKLRTVKQDGDPVSSRLIGDYLYVISNHVVYDTDIKNKKTEKMIPYVEDSSTSSGNIPADCVTILPDIDTTSYVVASGFNIKQNNKPDTKAVLGAANNIYCSNNNLYVLASNFNYSFLMARMYDDSAALEPPKTNIIKFNLDNGNLTNTASASVEGSVNNQYSVDEYNGNLRIALTIDKSYYTENYSSYIEDLSCYVYVLDNNLKQLGQTPNLAKNEHIKSVRFMGKKAYVVTFRTVDPFFVLDLSTPSNPKILGELKIPGFSEYLHPLNDNFIIGVGYNTEEISPDTVTTAGSKISLFDVSDPLNPKETDVYDLGPNSYLDTYDPKAMLFIDNGNGNLLMGVPGSISDPDAYYNIKDSGNFFNGYFLFNISEKEITIDGKVSHNTTLDDWSYSVNRGAIVDNILYTTSNSHIVASDLTSTDVNNNYKEIAKIYLPDPLYDYEKSLYEELPEEDPETSSEEPVTEKPAISSEEPVTEDFNESSQSESSSEEYLISTHPAKEPI